MWFAYALNLYFPVVQFGIRPRTLIGLIGIPIAPFIHANIVHAITNTVGIITFGVLFAALEGRYTRANIWFMIWVQGTLTWVLGRPGNHVGASGLVFGLFGYLLFLGLFQRRLRNFFLSVLVLLLYGGMMAGILPTRELVSWEAHLFGFIAGVLAAKYPMEPRHA